MSKVIRRHSEPRPQDLSHTPETSRASSKRKSMDIGPSSTLPSYINGSHRKSIDGSTRKRTQDQLQLVPENQSTQTKPSTSKKPSILNPLKKTTSQKRHVSAADATSQLTKKPKLDILNKPSKKKSLPQISSKPSGPSHAEPSHGNDEKTARCHQCRSEFPLEQILICQNTKPSTQKARPTEDGNSAPVRDSTSKVNSVDVKSVKCNMKYCAKCLRFRYGEEIEKIRPVLASAYVWTCPICMDYCNCSPCRKRKGLLPTGRLVKIAAEGGYASVRQLLEVVPNAQGPDMVALTNSKKQKLDEAKDSGKDSGITSKPTKSKHGKPQDDKASKATDAKPKKQVKPKSDVAVAIPALEKEKTAKSSHSKGSKGDIPSKKVQSVSQSKTPTAPSSVNPKGAYFSGSSDLTQPSTSQGGTSDGQAQPAVPKVPVKRGPKLVLAPECLSSIPTGELTSEQIQLRIHAREFVCRFRSLLPGLGRTEQANSKSETQRVEKILDSMDDIVNFWIDDEGGMRAIISALVKLILSEIDPEDPHEKEILVSDSSYETLVQLNKESKLSGMIPTPYHQTSSVCWATAQTFLTQEGLHSQLTENSKNIYIESAPSSDTRLSRVRVLPEQKVAVITGLIDVAFRGKILADDLVQGLERERIAKADIVKDRVKINKQWAEDKAQLVAVMPSKESLIKTDPPLKGKQLQKMQEEEEERLRALSEWEVRMAQVESEHKNALRLAGIAQYLAGSTNRIRFQPIGQDTRGNSYYILSSTPGRLYPQEQTELAYAWSYNLLIHGSEPSDLIPPVKKPTQAVIEKTSKESLPEDEDVDMLEGGQREANDQWIRISNPIEIRKLGSWIEYEAKLIEHKQLEHFEGSEGSDDLLKEFLDGNNSSLGGVVKSVSYLLEQINMFAEYLELKITESDEQFGKRSAKNRNHLITK
ncbi:zinc-finger domain of monoamine-oxidase A repressor R1-domain-containing protein [Melampsora americana]|nr:zinc-finger domain of monoamine-oxidase A repressor R1-domain-containing protein [Melampsora americana]